MDDRENPVPMKAEPAFDAEWAASPPASDPVVEDIPSWLKDPVPGAADAGRWRRTATLWGGSLLALAVVFGGAMWLFDEHKSSSAMQVVERTASAPAPAPAPVAVQPKADTLPPLVLLAPAPSAATPAPAAEVPPAPVSASPVKPVPKAPVPALAVARPKPSPPPKALVAKAAPVARKTKAPAVKKAPAVTKRPPHPVLAKGKSKGRVLATAAPAPKTCESGMLARECTDLH